MLAGRETRTTSLSRPWAKSSGPVGCDAAREPIYRCSPVAASGGTPRL